MVRTNMLEQPNFADWLSKCFKSKLFSQKLSLKISTCLVPPAPQKSHSAKKEAIKAAERDLEHGRKAYKNKAAEKKQRLSEQLEELEIQKTDREESKTIALGTSKLNYLDPRISMAWCKKHEVPIEKVLRLGLSFTLTWDDK